MKKHYLVILSLLIFLVACGSDYQAIDPTMNERVADFEFTTQDNETLSLNDLQGKWWIADFIFTNCTSVCLPMTSNMSSLQTKAKAINIDIQFVSFSVDPDYDQPEVLKEYAKEYRADLNNWSFLTGYDFQTIKELSIKSFRSLVKEPDRNSDQVTHGTGFMLVSPEGKVIKSYDGISSSAMDDILNDLITIEHMEKENET